jgi:hypothetical protein
VVDLGLYSRVPWKVLETSTLRIKRRISYWYANLLGKKNCYLKWYMVPSKRTNYPCKTSGFHGGDYEECRLLGYKTPVHTSQETQYISTTQPRQLIPCKISGFHGGDYECRLLGYENLILISQETHYVTATEPCRLILCKFWSFRSVAIKNAVFWDVSPCDSSNNRHFGVTYGLHHQCDKNRRARNKVSSN